MSRLTIVLSAVVIFSVTLSGCQPAIPGPHTLDRAKDLEKSGLREDALAMYKAVMADNQRTNPPLAARALYEGGAYASDPKRYGITPQKESDGQYDAAHMLRQLRDEWDSLKASEARDATGNPLKKETVQALFKDVTDKIDVRNRKEWKYQIIDSLVKVCGGKSWSYGLALILLAVLVKLILFPLTRKQYASQREMQRMQPLIKDLQKKYKGADLSAKQMELYKEHGVNPFAGCIPTLFMLPFMMTIFFAVKMYEFRFAAGHFLWIGSPLSDMFPGFLATNLAMSDIPLLVLYAVTNYITMRMSPAPDPQQQQQQNSMALMTTGLFFFMFMSSKWASAFVLYWLAQNLITIWQQYHFIFKPHKLRQAGGGDGGTPVGFSGGNGAGPTPKDASPLIEAKQPARVRPRKKKR